MRSLHIRLIYASTSGHTEYVVHVLLDALRENAPLWVIGASCAERCAASELVEDDVLVLATGTWNVGGEEGQLNPYMSRLLDERAKAVSLGDKPCACIGLGDRRYFYTARALDLLQQYVVSHEGRLMIPGLRIVNEPYGQEWTLRTWAGAFVSAADRFFGESAR